MGERRPISILHVLSERGFSGGENQLAAIVRFLHAQGHRQSFVLQPGAQFRKLAEEIGAEVDELRMRNDIDVIAALGLRRRLRETEADVVSFACARGHKLGGLASALGARPLRKGAAPRLMTRRMDYPLRGRFKSWLYRETVQRVIVISRAVQAQVSSLGVPEDHVRLIHEGVPSAELAQLRAAETVAAARAAYGIGPDELLGVTLASLHERKGLDVLIDALAEIKLPEGRRLRWLIGGQGPLLEALREHAQRRARPDCELQLLGQTDARQLLAAGELFALPSRLEGLGVALLEAMASGLPAVASRVGGMQDSMVDGETGHFAEPGDVKSLRAALQRLVSDGEARQRMGAAARDRAAAKFDVEAMCRATERVYLECAALRPKNDA